MAYLQQKHMSFTIQEVKSIDYFCCSILTLTLRSPIGGTQNSFFSIWTLKTEQFVIADHLVTESIKSFGDFFNQI